MSTLSSVGVTISGLAPATSSSTATVPVSNIGLDTSNDILDSDATGGVNLTAVPVSFLSITGGTITLQNIDFNLAAGTLDADMFSGSTSLATHLAFFTGTVSGSTNVAAESRPKAASAPA